MTRTIETAAELDTLPVGSVVLDHTGDAHQKAPANTVDPERWVSTLNESRSSADLVDEVAGTFTVLHNPGTLITADERVAMRKRYTADLPPTHVPDLLAIVLQGLGYESRSDVPRLLDALEAAEAEIAQLRAAHHTPAWDEDAMALAVFERSHEPPFEDSEEGMREAKKFVRSLFTR